MQILIVDPLFQCHRFAFMKEQVYLFSLCSGDIDVPNISTISCIDANNQLCVIFFKLKIDHFNACYADGMMNYAVFVWHELC